MRSLMGTVLTFLLLATTQISFAAGKAVDVSKFDIAGVRLGMTLEQAANAMASSLGISKSQIKYESIEHKNSLTMSRIQKQIKKVTGDVQVSYFSVKTQAGSYSVKLLPNVLNGNNKQMVVTNVSYSMPNTKDNAKAMADAMQQKYGKATGKDGGLVVWCASPKSGSCIYAEPQPKLIWNVSVLSMGLTDNRYEKAIDNYLNKQKNTKPAF